MSEETKTQRDLRLLREATRALSSALQETEIIRILLQRIVSDLGAHGALLRLLSPNAEELALADSVGLSDKYLQKGAVKIAESGIDRRALAGETVVIPDVTCEPGFRYREEAVCEGLRGLVSVPLTVRERVVGVLRIYVDDISALGTDEIRLLETLADLGAMVLEKVRFHQGLYNIAASLNSSLSLERMLPPVLEAMVKEMGVRAAALRLLDFKRQSLRMISAYGLSDAYLAKGEVHISKSAMDQRVLNGEVAMIYNAQNDPEVQYGQEIAREGIYSILAVPVKLKDQVIGSLRVYSAQPRRFKQVAIGFLTSVAGLVALAVENADLYSALQARYEDLKLDLAEWRKFLALG